MVIQRIIVSANTEFLCDVFSVKFKFLCHNHDVV